MIVYEKKKNQNRYQVELIENSGLYAVRRVDETNTAHYLPQVFQLEWCAVLTCKECANKGQ